MPDLAYLISPIIAIEKIFPLFLLMLTAVSHHLKDSNHKFNSAETEIRAREPNLCVGIFWRC